MIKKAHKLSSKSLESSTKFIVWDMTTINLEKKFDVILCNYNSICHLNYWEDWQKFFKNSYKHLKKNWILIFDILTIFEFENISRDFRGFFNVKDDIICLEMFKNKNTNKNNLLEYIYKWDIKMFINQWKNNYKLVEEEIKEVSFDIEIIKKELQNIWFKLKHLEDYALWEINDESERVYFVSQK
jgi:SAM-dependent methyltransferase